MRKQRVLQRAFGLDDAVVEDVDYDEAVIVSVRPTAKVRNRCGQCVRRSPGYDRGEGCRRWRALDLGTCRGLPRGGAPRVACATHSATVRGDLVLPEHNLIRPWEAPAMGAEAPSGTVPALARSRKFSMSPEAELGDEEVAALVRDGIRPRSRTLPPLCRRIGLPSPPRLAAQLLSRLSRQPDPRTR